MTPLKFIIESINGPEQPKEQKEPKVKPRITVPLNKMTYEQLHDYEPPRNKIKEWFYQSFEANILTGLLGIGTVREMFLPACHVCWEQKTRHLKGWDGGQMVCGNPLCSECTSMMTIRSMAGESKYQDKEFQNAITKEGAKQGIIYEFHKDGHGYSITYPKN